MMSLWDVIPCMGMDNYRCMSALLDDIDIRAMNFKRDV